MNKEELRKIEIKKDGQNAERFGDFLRKVVNVPKEDVKKYEEKQKKKAKKS